MLFPTHCLGFPRIGLQRELKWLLEGYWRGKNSREELWDGALELRQRHWQLQRQAGLSMLTCGDFTLYDQTLDTTMAVGAIPARFRNLTDPTEQFFTMARGNKTTPACEMTKWFNTNYHYLVPELEPNQAFHVGPLPLTAQLAEAGSGARKAVLLGPVTYLYLAKTVGESDFSRLDLLEDLLPVYRQILAALKAAGAEWVQLDEPVLTMHPEDEWWHAAKRASEALFDAGPKLMLTTYFSGLGEKLETMLQLPVHGFHLDALNSGDELEKAAALLPTDKVLSAGVVNGRNIWRCDLEKTLQRLTPLAEKLDERLWIASSCSLQHCPVDLNSEVGLDDESKKSLAFAVQKLDEIALLGRALADPQDDTVRQALADSNNAQQTRKLSQRVHKKEVGKRINAIHQQMLRRAQPYPVRAKIQAKTLKLPLFPTTTIGSFPQTAEIRAARLKKRRGEMDDETYTRQMQQEIQRVIQEQETLGLDVLVHGEPERNDMVEYFGALLDGMLTTDNGWVQSYGSRCVKPPIIYGDIHRPAPMTVSWAQYAQHLTEKPVKGMLTGPITILCWSFQREDVHPSTSANQIALALRDEVADLEKAGLHIIQIDEPAFREGMPLRRCDWPAYFSWAIDAFLLASCGAADETQIHSHMCYAEFNDIIREIARLDADVISIETARSNMELLNAFHHFKYPNEIGPGVYDIHSPRTPLQDEMEQLMNRAIGLIDPSRLWVNPDCGLKTRRWEEVRPALLNLVEMAQRLRSQMHD